MLGIRPFIIIRRTPGYYEDGVAYEGIEERIVSKGNLQVPNINAEVVVQDVVGEYQKSRYVLYTRKRLLYLGDVSKSQVADRVEWTDKRGETTRYKVVGLSNWEVPGLGQSHLKYTLQREEV